MLRSAGRTGDWLTYAGNYAGYRHGIENQITRDNIQRVRLAWAAQLPSDGGFQESSPIVVGGRMFVTEPPEGVTALNAKLELSFGSFIALFRPMFPCVAAFRIKALQSSARTFMLQQSTHISSLWMLLRAPRFGM